ncbi:hypothetical protein FA13DRAFT_1634414 [Coprinellus micaceus]|uniref:BTB domain-containing protein n=1 Tax=Coprinellus micaceus TaxID=71717 RepID=A0A4Y7T0U6_COPMI|nr:hypothetical protein FA13DRAFT_1634414 [Coprinellus micaceus]
MQADEELWYGDGNLIILSGDLAFRVYRGLLSKGSPVFGDMFEFPTAQGRERNCRRGSRREDVGQHDGHE